MMKTLRRFVANPGNAFLIGVVVMLVQQPITGALLAFITIRLIARHPRRKNDPTP
jgi:phosphate/sulfate permease